MTRPIGKLQLQLLMSLASPSCLLIVGDQLSSSLVQRGLLAPKFPDRPDAFHRITPSGMRALADAFEAGRLEPFFAEMTSREPNPGLDA